MSTETKTTSLIIVKPEGVKRGLIGKIISRFEKRGIEIITIDIRKPTLQEAQAHYIEHEKKFFFKRITESLSSAPVCIFLIKCENAVKVARKMIGGSSKPFDCEPGTIRGDFAVLESENVIHASDSDESARRETQIWFYHVFYAKFFGKDDKKKEDDDEDYDDDDLDEDELNKAWNVLFQTPSSTFFK